jgi:hypothetical protein
MARTRFSAKFSTGGPAKRVKIRRRGRPVPRTSVDLPMGQPEQTPDIQVSLHYVI